MYMGCCAVLHMQNVVICVPSLNLKLVSNMHFLHHLNQLFLQILVIQGYICTKHSRFCWFVTSGKKRIFWDTASWSSHKGSKGAHAAKTFSRAIKCPIYLSSVTFVKNPVLIFIESFLLYTSLCFHSIPYYYSIMLHQQLILSQTCMSFLQRPFHSFCSPNYRLA